MKRFAAHFIYCNPQRIIHKGVVEVDDNGVIQHFFSLNALPQESHTTIFYNGILIPNLLEKGDLSSLTQETVFKTLDNFFSLKKRTLEEGQKADLFLLENLDFIENKFLTKTSLTQIL